MINNYWSKWWIGVYIGGLIISTLSYGLLKIIGEEFKWYIIGYLFSIALTLGFFNYFFEKIKGETK
jgi:predicted ABC-type sugar transport system permease subunit